jgi:membrane protein required for colicin V production
MTALDILVLLTVGFAAVLGMSRGFVTETLSLAAWVLAILAVKILHAPVSESLAGIVGTEAGAAVLAFALIFGLTMMAARFAARKLGEKSKQSVVGSFDRILGLGFGALKGLVIASVIFLVITFGTDILYGGSESRPAWMRESRTYPLLNASSRALVDLVEARRKGNAEAVADAPPAR